MQELVNLALTGTARPHVFDDKMVPTLAAIARPAALACDCDAPHRRVRCQVIDSRELLGIQRQSSVGFLSLFEHYGYVKVVGAPPCFPLSARSPHAQQVGSNLKRPRVPVWVVCSESHYTTLFSADRSVYARGRRSPMRVPPRDACCTASGSRKRRIVSVCSTTTASPSNARSPSSASVRGPWSGGRCGAQR